MPDDVFRCDAPTAANALQQLFEGRHLGFCKGVIATIVQFDSDGPGVDIVQAAPFPRPSMPGPLRLIDHAGHRPITCYEIMCRNFGFGIAQARNRSFGACHRGIVQDNNARRQTIPARPKIRGRMQPQGLTLSGFAERRRIPATGVAVAIRVKAPPVAFRAAPLKKIDLRQIR